VNAILVTLLTMLAINMMPQHQFFLLLGLWIGIVIGLLIGLALCRLCLDRLIATTRGIGGNHAQ
jgi:TctA family transporter